MSQTIALNPITRIEGHLAVKVETDGKRVTQAYMAGGDVSGLRDHPARPRSAGRAAGDPAHLRRLPGRARDRLHLRPGRGVRHPVAQERHVAAQLDPRGQLHRLAHHALLSSICVGFRGYRQDRGVFRERRGALGTEGLGGLRDREQEHYPGGSVFAPVCRPVSGGYGGEPGRAQALPGGAGDAPNGAQDGGDLRRGNCPTPPRSSPAVSRSG